MKYAPYLAIVIAVIAFALWNAYSGETPGDNGNVMSQVPAAPALAAPPATADTPPPLPAGRHTTSASASSPPPVPASRHHVTGESDQPPPLPANTVTAAHAGGLHLRRVQIMDHQGFDRSIPAMSVLIPVDWRADGQVVWNPAATCLIEGRQLQWRTDSADGTSGMELLPVQVWTMSSMSPGGMIGCRPGDTRSIRAHLEQLARARRPGGRLIDYRERPDLATERENLFRQSMMRAPGQQEHRWVEVGELWIAYAEDNHEMHEVLLIAGYFSETHIDIAGYQARTFMGFVEPGMSYRAPAGMVNMRLMEAVRQSGRAEPEWLARVSQLDARITRNAMQHMNERHRINMDAIHYVGELNTTTFNNRSASQDRTVHAFNQAVREVETWSDPGSTDQRFELPQGYDNAWRLDDDTFILTDNPDFHPYQALGLRGRQLQRGG